MVLFLFPYCFILHPCRIRTADYPFLTSRLRGTFSAIRSCGESNAKLILLAREREARGVSVQVVYTVDVNIRPGSQCHVQYNQGMKLKSSTSH